MKLAALNDNERSSLSNLDNKHAVILNTLCRIYGLRYSSDIFTITKQCPLFFKRPGLVKRCVENLVAMGLVVSKPNSYVPLSTTDGHKPVRFKRHKNADGVWVYQCPTSYAINYDEDYLRDI
jgi:hypothetical protein